MAYFKISEIPENAIVHNDDYFFGNESREVYVLCEVKGA